MNRELALSLVHDYTQSDALRKHMYAVEIAMRAMAERYGGDPDAWGVVGLVHDFDYERFPNPEHAPDREHPAEGVRILAERGLSPEGQQAILGHAAYTGTPRITPMAQALFAVDELCGFLVACALVRPSRLTPRAKALSLSFFLTLDTSRSARLREGRTSAQATRKPQSSSTANSACAIGVIRGVPV